MLVPSPLFVPEGQERLAGGDVSAANRTPGPASETRPTVPRPGGMRERSIATPPPCGRPMITGRPATLLASLQDARHADTRGFAHPGVTLVPRSTARLISCVLPGRRERGPICDLTFPGVPPSMCRHPRVHLTSKWTHRPQREHFPLASFLQPIQLGNAPFVPTR